MTTAPPVARNHDFAPAKWSGRVLIVEDDAAQLQTLSDILRDEGFHVHACTTGAQALRYLDTAPPVDVAIVDLRLPDLDGTLLLEEIRKRNTEIRVIIHTGYGSFGSAKDAVNIGAFAYVEKLGNPHELIRHVHRAVTQRVQQSNVQLEAAIAARTAALQDSESRLRAIVESAADAIIVIDDQERIDTFNSAAERMFGFTAAEARGQKLSQLLPDPVAPDGGNTLADYLRGASVATLHLVNRELTARRKGGAGFPVELRASEIRLDNRRMWIGIVRDITERKNLEEQLRQAQKMEAVGRLAGGIAHDFNNLLTVINGYCDVLLEDLPAGSPVREVVEEIGKSGQRAATLTRQLLAFSRKQIRTLAIVNLNDVVRGMERMLTRLIGSHIEFVTGLQPDLGLVEADRSQLEQIIVNLAVNARDAMREGGQLLVTTRNTLVQAGDPRFDAETKPGPAVCLTVSDTGVGMDAQTQRFLFEPFFTTKGLGGGTGLGLATVYGIVKQSHGHILVRSAPGQGATFEIYMPQVAPQVTAASSGPAPATPHGGKEIVLLVEDDDAVRSLMQRILKGDGYTVLEARSGDEALQTAAQFTNPLHLMLTDMIMPKMSGRELAARIHQLHPETKVVFMSGHSEELLLESGPPPEHSGFIQKPFSPTALGQLIRHVLDQGKEKSEIPNPKSET
jgi:PAS domain S-box-containing protein